MAQCKWASQPWEQGDLIFMFLEALISPTLGSHIRRAGHVPDPFYRVNYPVLHSKITL